MITRSRGLIYAIFFLSCLSTFYCVSFKDSKSQSADISSNTNDTTSDLAKLIGLIRSEVNITIQEELTKIIQSVVRNLPAGQFCQAVSKCNCTGKPGPKGAPGPPGPPGKEGKRGLGLFFPRLKQASLDPVANESDNEILECKFFGNPIPTVAWKHDFASTSMTVKIDHNESVITSYLHVKDITWDDRGNVTCTAESILGRANATGFLTVHAAPIISLPNGPIYANLGSTFKFPECKVVSSPPAKITWKRGYGKLPVGRHWKKHGNLEIYNVRVRDDGYYVCEAENYLGKAIKSLQFKSRRLQFSKRPAYLIQAVTSSKVIQCSALGTPTAMSGKVVLLNENKNISVNVSTTETSFTLTAEITRSGIYKCVIEEFAKTIETGFNVKLFALSSSILSENQTNSLAEWLKEESAIGKYALCYKGTSNGWSSSTFHSLCDKKPHTISIFKSSNLVFGGYSDIAWSSSAISYTSSRAFIFTFASKKRKILIKRNNQAVCYSGSYGPCFGQSDLFAIQQYNGFGYLINQYRNNMGQSFESNTDISSSGSLSELEVFYRV